MQTCVAMLSFRQLEVFRSVMVSGSISAASQQLNIAQPTVSNTIKRLEDVLGVRLFHRNAGRLTPTRTARQIFEIVQPSMTGLEQLSSTVFEIASGQSVTLRMGVSPSVSQALGPKALAKLARRNPGAKLRMDTLSLTQIKDYLWLAEGDCVVTIYPVNDAMIVSQKIAEISMACIVPRDHPMANNESVYIDQLADERLIFFHPNTPHGRWVKDMFEERDIKPNITIETRFAESAISLMYEDFGIAIVDELTATGVRDPDIKPIPFADGPRLPVLLHHHKDHGARRVIETIRESLTEAAREIGLEFVT
ncbi:LysR family transcriptional regulator [Hoeflea sp. CAU 1731]